MDYVRTAYSDETNLLSDVLKLYNGGKPIDLDPCYSIGRIYRKLSEPRLKFDVSPQADGVIQASSTNLPIPSSSVLSALFDPPFVTGGKTNTGIISTRFSHFRTIEDLIQMYFESMLELKRVVVPDGLILFKCQDQVYFHKQFMTHVHVINKCYELGMFVHDLIVLHRKHAIISGHVKKQEHARKTHCYYLVISNGLKNPALRWK